MISENQGVQRLASHLVVYVVLPYTGDHVLAEESKAIFLDPKVDGTRLLEGLLLASGVVCAEKGLLLSLADWRDQLPQTAAEKDKDATVRAHLTKYAEPVDQLLQNCRSVAL